LARALAIQQGHPAQQRRFARRLLAWQKAAPFSVWSYFAATTSAALRVFCGDPEALASIEHARLIGLRAAGEFARDVHFAQRLTLALEVGLSSDLDSLLALAPEATKTSDLGLAITAFANALLWRDDESRNYFEQLIPRVSDGIANRPLGLAMLTCELIAHHGDHRRASLALAALGSTADCLGTTGAVGAIFGPMGYALGGLAASIGDASAALHYFRAAGEASARVGSARWVLRCERAVARLRFVRKSGRWHIERAVVD
jgi:hypothetical protein